MKVLDLESRVLIRILAFRGFWTSGQILISMSLGIFINNVRVIFTYIAEL